MQLSWPLISLPSDCIDQIYKKEGPAEESTGHIMMEQSKRFSYCTLMGELMHSYIMCQPDIGYAGTTLSKFSSLSTALYYKLLKGVIKYLQSTIN